MEILYIIHGAVHTIRRQRTRRGGRCQKLVEICRHGWVAKIQKKLPTSFMDGSYDVSMHELIRGQNSYCCAWRALKFNDFISQ